MAGNSLLTPSAITREAIRLWKNTNSFLNMISTQYDDQYANGGGKIGTQLRIRLPNDYPVNTGPALSVSGTNEQQVVMTLATQKHVDVGFSSLDRTMSLENFSDRILRPMVNNLLGAVAVDVMGGCEGGVSNLVVNTDGATPPNMLTPVAFTWLDAGARLDEMSAPRGDRAIIMSPRTQAVTVDTLKGLFNPNGKISEQYDSGEIYSGLGFDWYMDQTVRTHVPGAYGNASTVTGAGQVGMSIGVSGLAAALNVGDIIEIGGVNSVNRITKQDNGTLAQFVVTQAAPAGSTTVDIYPAIIPPDAFGNPVQYQTVTNSPANGATVEMLTPASLSYRKNIALHKEAVTMAYADLELPRGVHEAVREKDDNVSMRLVTQYDINSDVFATRLDVLYGYLWVRPEWAVAVADPTQLTNT